jgi:predicted SAM-dependent methyltransferase
MNMKGVRSNNGKGMTIRNLISGVKHRLTQFSKERSSRADIERYIRSSGGALRLNLGSQSNRPRGWLNVDINPGTQGVYLDATNMSAIPDGSFDAVLCEHMIEHVSRSDGMAVMRSIHRVLKPGGVARFVTPRLDRLAQMILNQLEASDREIELFAGEFINSNIGKEYPDFSRVDYINIMFRQWGHQYLYTREDLTEKLQSVGFPYGVETIPSAIDNNVFEAAQGHGRLLGHEMNDLNAFALEVTK